LTSYEFEIFGHPRGIDHYTFESQSEKKPGSNREGRHSLEMKVESRSTFITTPEVQRFSYGKQSLRSAVSTVDPFFARP
jgi:hypothetical protein